MAFLLGEVLRDLNVSRIAFATSVQEAEAECMGAAHALALVDLSLGGESGVAFIRAIRRDPFHPAHRMPVIVVSGQGSLGAIEAAKAAGADWFLVKPVRTWDLVDRISRVLAAAQKPALSDPDDTFIID